MHLSCWYIYSICFWVNVCTLESSYTFIQTKQKLNTTKTECRKIFQWEIGAHLSHQYLFVCILLIYNTFVILFSLTINAHQLRNKKENNLWLNLAATVFPSIQSVIDANVIKKKKRKRSVYTCQSRIELRSDLVLQGLRLKERRWMSDVHLFSLAGSICATVNRRNQWYHWSLTFIDAVMPSLYDEHSETMRTRFNVAGNTQCQQHKTRWRSCRHDHRPWNIFIRVTMTTARLHTGEELSLAGVIQNYVSHILRYEN